LPSLDSSDIEQQRKKRRNMKVLESLRDHKEFLTLLSIITKIKTGIFIT
jgi:hypothetical protein